MSLEVCLTMEPGVCEYDEQELFDTDAGVHILGRTFTGRNEYNAIRRFHRSLFWMTYRRNFPPIGGVGPTSDQGWGCMLRCGQMMLARTMAVLLCGDDTESILERHPEEYRRLLSLFADHRAALYSIHQIAQMGVSEGKQITEWFGPNTCAQVLRKLSAYDRWLHLGIYVVMDNLFIIEDILKVHDVRSRLKLNVAHTLPHMPVSDELHEDSIDDQQSSPVLIIIPLRLGLTQLNMCYEKALHAFFSLRWCVGILGGQPNRALYFTGSCNGNLLYLDPHICHDSLVVHNGAAAEGEDADETDHEVIALADVNEQATTSYHCDDLFHMPICDVDPSLALGLVIRDRNDLMELVTALKERVLPLSSPQLFELLDKRPNYLPAFIPYPSEHSPNPKEYAVMEPRYDTDEEFEVLE